MTNDQELRTHISSTINETTNAQSKGYDMTYFKIMSPNVASNKKTVLGVGWDVLTDEFVFWFKDLLKKYATIENTERNLLSVLATIFDPLGLIAPVTARI